MGSVRSYVDALDSRLSQIQTDSPRVAVVITNYNYSEYVQHCLHSVSLQTYPNLECIIVDDCSSDESVKIIQQFIQNNKAHVKFRLIQHESRRGQYAAFRTGVAHTDAPFLSFVDADDLLLPDFVSEHVRVHLHYPPVAFTSSNQYQIDSRGQLIGGSHPDLHTWSTYKSVGTVSLRRPFWVWATTSSMMFRRTALDYILSDVDDTFKKCADNYVCHFADLLGGSILIPSVLGCYRRHQRNIFSNNPLVGGRHPTGDMRYHPAHDAVLNHIRSRLFERHPQFMALLGMEEFLLMLAKVTKLGHLPRTGCFVLRIGGFPNFCLIFCWLNLRMLVRLLRGRCSNYSLHDLEGVKRGGNVASYTEYQRHRRDAK